MLGLDSEEAAVNEADKKLGRQQRVGAVEAEEEVEVIVAEAIEEASRQKMKESEEKDGAIVIEEEGREVEAGVELEGVVFGGVVGKERGGREGAGGSPSRKGGERRWTLVGWRLPLLGLTRRDQVEKPVVF